MSTSMPVRLYHFASAFLRDPLAHWPFGPIFRQVMGNTAGAKQNLFGGLQLAYYRMFGKNNEKQAVDDETRSAIRRLQATGILKIDKPILSKQLIADLQMKFDRLAKTSRMRQKHEYMIVFDGQEIKDNVPELFEIFGNPKLRTLIHSFFNSAFHINQITYRRTFHVPDEVANRGEVYSNYWHCDSVAVSELALFINLVDVDDESGPTRVIDKPHSKHLVRRFYRKRSSPATIKALDAAIKENNCARAFTGEAGSMIFVQTTKCLHRASIPKKGKSRDWISIRLMPKNAPTVDDQIIRNPVFRYTHGMKS